MLINLRLETISKFQQIVINATECTYKWCELQFVHLNALAHDVVVSLLLLLSLHRRRHVLKL